MKKLIFIIVGMLVILSALTAYIIYDGINYAPARVNVRYETVQSENIPESLNHIQIVYFSDLHYNMYMDEARFQQAIDKIIEIDPDIILFGGDLFDHPSVNYPAEETINTLIAQLQSLEAKLGKYAVYGNHDLESPASKELVYSTLTAADFEVLENENIRIYNNDNKFIQLVGLDCELLGNVDINQAFLYVENNIFTITMVHTPDTVSQVPQNPTELVLSGHSHGGQVYIPLLGPLERVSYAEIYNHGIYKVGNIQLDVSNGLGTTREDIRIFSEPEIVVYTIIRK